MDYPQSGLVGKRAEALSARLRSLLSLKPISVTFVPSDETSFIGYFSKGLHAELQSSVPEGFRYLPPQAGGLNADVLVLTAHGADLSTVLWELRTRVRNETIIALWLWDNHLAPLGNYRTALAADFVFPSHAFSGAYLFNPLSVVANHVPACSAQWTFDEARKIVAENAEIQRRSKALVNYVNYPFSPRSALFRELAAHLPQAELLLMPPGDRSRYFSKSSELRLREWLEYKATIILPVDRDLSTRVFDALLAGQVPIVPTSIKDFDTVIPPQTQRELGIVRVQEENVESLMPAVITALQTFDRMGADGVRRRQEFVLNHHMLRHRFNQILRDIAEMAQRASIVSEIQKPGFGLYLVPRST